MKLLNATHEVIATFSRPLPDRIGVIVLAQLVVILESMQELAITLQLWSPPAYVH